MNLSSMSDSLPSRRDFLSIGSQRDGDQNSASDESEIKDADELQRRVRELMYVEHYSNRAMACQFEFIFNLGQYEQASEVALIAFEEINRLEDQMTVYRDWSELSRINQQADKEWVAVESNLFRLLEKARELWQLTDGAFDITSTPLSRVWGFSKREGRFPSDEELALALASTGMEHVDFDAAAQRLKFTKPGIELNLGGIGKGYALDVCAELLEEQGMGSFMIHGGQSSILARGKRTGIEQAKRKGWTVGLSHPVWPERRLVEFQLQDRSLGTSGTGRQAFYYRGKKYGHILDPRSGLPSDGVLSSTVLAPTAAEADALATAFYVLGLEGAQTVCDQRKDIGMLLVTNGARRGDVEIHTCGLSEDEWKYVGT